MMDSLEALLSGYEHFRDIGNNLLIAGLVAEALITCFAPDDRKILKRVLELLATLVVLIGVAIEVRYGSYADDTSRQLRQLSAEKIADLNKQAEALSLARAAIEKELAFRTLSVSDRAELVETLKPFAGQRFGLFIYNGENEIFDATAQVVVVLLAAHWSLGDRSRLGTESGRAVSGILIETALDADDTSRQAAKTLATALFKKGLSVTGPNPEDPSIKRAIAADMSDFHSPIRVTIGTRPIEPKR